MKKFNPDDKKIELNKGHLIMAFSALLIIAIIGISYATYTTESEEHIVINSKVGEFTLSDIELAVMVDGVKQDTFPAKSTGYYYLSTTCDNGSTGTWDYEEWALSVKYTKQDKCTVNFATDNTPPEVTFTTSVDIGEISFTITASDTQSGVAEYQYYVDETLVHSSTSGSYTRNISAGTHVAKVIVIDYAGNTKELSQSVSVPSCFVAGTKVLTANGYKNIEDIEVGEYVYTINLDTNERVLERVINTLTSETTQLYEIKIGEELIEATPRHQFYVRDKGWIRAYDLEVGDQLVAKDDDSLKIDSIKLKTLDETIEVYNLTIENQHNYLVTESEILVHNAGSPA